MKCYEKGITLTLSVPIPQNSKLPTNSLSVFDHFVGLTLKGLIIWTVDNNKETKQIVLSVCWDAI